MCRVDRIDGLARVSSRSGVPAYASPARETVDIGDHRLDHLPGGKQMRLGFVLSLIAVLGLVSVLLTGAWIGCGGGGSGGAVVGGG